VISVLDEARDKTLANIPVKRAGVAQQAALMRLQLWFTGETHRILSKFSEKAARYVRQYAGSDGVPGGGEMYQAQRSILSAWDETFIETWLPLFPAVRREAAAIPFGTLALRHKQYFDLAKKQLSEDQAGSPVFEPQLAAVVEAANQRIYADGLTLSSRVWKLDRDARAGLQRTLMAGLTEQKSAWDVAKDLEGFLGAGQDCPRWVSTRLYVLTKKDIASGDRRGLKTGKECDGQGVAYKALRMARNEIQAVHHEASRAIMAAQPWVEKEQINLSPAHPKPDICDDVVKGGEGGKGIYPIGQIVLPIHVSCLCFSTAVLMRPTAFVQELRGWQDGEPDPALDDYAAFLGVPKADVAGLDLFASPIAQALAVWLWGKVADLAKRVGL